jgi:CHAT domain-containing protein/tetratricopeptide (TPR) repeat protein
MPLEQALSLTCPTCEQHVDIIVPAVLDLPADALSVEPITSGSLFERPCPVCGSNVELDFPLIVIFDERALPIWFVVAERTTNEEDSADWKRLSTQLESALDSAWEPAWSELFWVARRSELGALALGGRFASRESRPLLSPLTALRHAEDMASLRGVLDAHPALLADDALELLGEIVEMQWLKRKEGAAADYDDDFALLLSCREIGIDQTLTDLDRTPAEALQALHAAADEATETYTAAPTREHLESRLEAHRNVATHPEYARAPNGFRWRIELGFAYLFHDWFEREGDPEKLDLAIDHVEQALALMPVLSRRERCVLLNSLGKWRMDRYSARDERPDLEAAISAWQEAYSLAPKASPKALQIVGNLGRALRDRFQSSGDTTDLDRSVQLLLEGHETATRFNQLEAIAQTLNSLAYSYHARYQALGSPDDLEPAVQAFASVYTDERTDPGTRRRAAHNLADALLTRFDRVGNLADLDNAISLTHALAKSAPNKDERAYTLHNFGTACLTRYFRSRDRRDLDAAITAFEENPSVTPAIAVRCAEALVARYDLQQDLADLKQALKLLESALDAATPDTPVSSALQAQLGNAYARAFARSRNAEFLNHAVASFEVARELTPPDAPVLPVRLFHLGRALAQRHQHGNDAQDLTRAQRLLDFGCQAGLKRDPQVAFDAGRFWGDWSAERGDWSAAGRAFNYAATAASLLLRVQPNRAAREILLKAAQGLATARAHCLVKMRRPEDAASALESGRSRLRDRSRVSEAVLNRLLAIGHGGLVKRYRDLVAMMDDAHESESPELEEQLKRVLSEIDRQIDLDTQWNTMAWVDVAAITRSPRAPAIVYMSTYRDHTLALVVSAGRVRSIELPLDEKTLDLLLLAPRPTESLTPDELAALHVERRASVHFNNADSLLEHYTPRDPDAYEAIDRPWSRERYLEVGAVEGGWLAAQRGCISYEQALPPTLRVLWEKVLDPLTQELPAGHAEPTGVVLIPVGELALLPLHAAWQAHARDDQRGTRIFTYAPDARALIRPARPTTFIDTRVTHLLAVGNPQADTKPLDYAELEVYVCSAFVPTAARTVLVKDDARLKNVRDHLQSATLLHFACHGRFEPSNPMTSAVYLADGGRLTLAELSRLRLPQQPLVILSACETAITDTRFLPDEALGLAHGFLEAGARGVISTLWPVPDVSTMLLVEEFYRQYVEGRATAPRALRDAADSLRAMTAGHVRDRLDRLRSLLPSTHPLLPPVIRQYRRFAAMRVEKVPFESVYYWGGFTYSGR